MATAREMKNRKAGVDVNSSQSEYTNDGSASLYQLWEDMQYAIDHRDTDYFIGKWWGNKKAKLDLESIKLLRARIEELGFTIDMMKKARALEYINRFTEELARQQFETEKQRLELIRAQEKTEHEHRIAMQQKEREEKNLALEEKRLQNKIIKKVADSILENLNAKKSLSENESHLLSQILNKGHLDGVSLEAESLKHQSRKHKAEADILESKAKSAKAVAIDTVRSMQEMHDGKED